MTLKYHLQTGRPISIVEDDGLQQVLHIALQNAKYKISCQHIIDTMLTDKYNNKMGTIKGAEKYSKAIELMSDFWPSLGNESYSYCGIICHWIIDDSNLKSVVLECVHVVSYHYSANITQLYKQFGKDWDIAKKIQILVIDMA